MERIRRPTPSPKSSTTRRAPTRAPDVQDTLGNAAVRQVLGSHANLDLARSAIQRPPPHDREGVSEDTDSPPYEDVQALAEMMPSADQT